MCDFGSTSGSIPFFLSSSRWPGILLILKHSDTRAHAPPVSFISISVSLHRSIIRFYITSILHARGSAPCEWIGVDGISSAVHLTNQLSLGKSSFEFKRSSRAGRPFAEFVSARSRRATEWESVINYSIWYSRDTPRSVAASKFLGCARWIHRTRHERKNTDSLMTLLRSPHLALNFPENNLDQRSNSIKLSLAEEMAGSSNLSFTSQCYRVQSTNAGFES